jgi:hypothetical protein
MMDTIEPADIDQAAGPRLEALADQLRRLGPNRLRPEEFHLQKDAIAVERR